MAYTRRGKPIIWMPKTEAEMFNKITPEIQQQLFLILFYGGAQNMEEIHSKENNK